MSFLDRYLLERLQDPEFKKEWDDSELEYLRNKTTILDGKHNRLTNKLADIRELFDESDMEAEGHGMEDMIADPHAVACYTESKMKRMIAKIEEYEEVISSIANIDGLFIDSPGLISLTAANEMLEIIDEIVKPIFTKISLEKSLKEMQQIRKGEMKAVSWDEFMEEME